VAMDHKCPLRSAASRLAGCCQLTHDSLPLEAESHWHMGPRMWCQRELQQKALDENLSFSKTKYDSGRKFRRQPTDFARHWAY
jgi:hypothetical protein